MTASTGVPASMRFPGQWYQSESGLYQNWMRDYDPTTGRYIQADPLGLIDGASVYGYARQNPEGYADPDGQFAWALAFAGIDIAWQLYEHGWRIECINWFEVGFSMVGGIGLDAWKVDAFVFKRLGSHTYDATRKWMVRNAINPRSEGQVWHHWLAERNQGPLRGLSNGIKNQPWNLSRISEESNQFANKYSNYGANLLGAPQWARAIPFATLAFLAGNGCGCDE